MCSCLLAPTHIQNAAATSSGSSCGRGMGLSKNWKKSKAQNEANFNSTVNPGSLLSWQLCGVKRCLLCTPVVGPWISHRLSLGLHFFFCKWRPGAESIAGTEAEGRTLGACTKCHCVWWEKEKEGSWICRLWPLGSD